MEGMFTAGNIKKGAIVALAILIAQNFTANQSTLVRGAITVGAAIVALPLASKV